MRRACVCACVCVYQARRDQSEFSTVTKTSFLCISFQFNRADSQVNRLSVWGEPGWEKCRVLKQRTGHIQSRKKWLLSFKKTPRSHTMYVSDVWAERGGRVLPALWGPAWEWREWRDLPVQGTTGGHAACEATDPGLLEVRNAEDVGSNDSHRVRRVHEEPVLAQNHVPILWKKGNSKRDLLIKVLKKPNDLTWRFRKI